MRETGTFEAGRGGERGSDGEEGDRDNDGGEASRLGRATDFNYLGKCRGGVSRDA